MEKRPKESWRGKTKKNFYRKDSPVVQGRANSRNGRRRKRRLASHSDEGLSRCGGTENSKRGIKCRRDEALTGLFPSQEWEKRKTLSQERRKDINQPKKTRLRKKEGNPPPPQKQWYGGYKNEGERSQAS